MSILNPIFKQFIRKQAVKQTGKIPPADTVLDLNAANLQKRLQNMGIDTSKIKNTKEIEQALNIEKSQWNQQIKQTAEAAPKNILKGTQKKPFTGWTPRVVEKSMPTDDYNVLKEEWFGKIIANTDDAINTFLKKGIDKADDRFLNLSKTQRKDFLDMVEYRLKHGNKKFMNDFTDAAGKFKFPENLAGGGRAGYDSGKLVEGETYIPPKNFYGVGLGPLLNEFMSEGRPRDEEGFHTTLNKKDLINLWNYLKENQDIDLEDELMFRFGRFDPEKKSQFHFGVGKDKAEIGFKKKFAGGGIAGMLGERTGYFKGALADTKKGKAMSPGTSADYSPGQGHRETRETKVAPPGAGTQTYTEPPKHFEQTGFLSDVKKANKEKYLNFLKKYPLDEYRKARRFGETIMPEKEQEYLRSLNAGDFWSDMHELRPDYFHEVGPIPGAATGPYWQNPPEYHWLAGGGIAGMLGEPTYEDDNHRVPLKGGKSVVLKNLAKLFDEFFPGTTKIGQTSKPMASKTELRRAITDFKEREKAAKFKEMIKNKYQGKIDDNLLNKMLVDDNPQRIAEVMATIDEALIMQGKGMGPETIMTTLRDSWKRKKNATGGLAHMVGE